MMPASDNLALFTRVAWVAVPVGLYFLILGLLNTRRTPQILGGRLDFALFILAMSPLVLIPAVAYFGLGTIGICMLLGLVVATVLLGPSRHCWVVYNLPSQQAAHVVAQAMEAAGLSATQTAGGFELPDQARLELTHFPLLRNLTIRLRGGDAALAQKVSAGLGLCLSQREAQTTPAGMAMLLVAVATLVAPLSLVVHRMPELVRLVNDLLK